MKRIAFIYTGYLRTWDLCKNNHRDNIFSGDSENHLFFYTYERPLLWEVIRSQKTFSWVGIPEPFHANPWEPHKYDARKKPENTVNQTLNQWINNFVGFRLVPKGFDVYVRIRPDITFNGLLNFDDHDCTGNNIYIPQGNDYGGINDQFAFGSYEVMKIYYSVLFNCHQLWEDGAEWHSEGMQLSNLQKFKVDIVRLGYPQHNIQR